MAQRDPLVEYQREGYELFNAMMDAIKEESVGNLFNLEVQVQQSPIIGEAGPDGEWSDRRAAGRRPAAASRSPTRCRPRCRFGGRAAGPDRLGGR